MSIKPEQVRHKTLCNARLRKITFIRDRNDNYKICDIIKRPRLNRCNSSTSDFCQPKHYAQQPNMQLMNASCFCEECGGKVKKNRIACTEFQSTRQILVSQIISNQNNPNRQSQYENSMMGSQQLMSIKRKQSILQSMRMSIKPVISMMQTASLMKKIQDNHSGQILKTIQPLKNELFFEKIQPKFKDLTRKSSLSPQLYRTRSNASLQFLSKLTQTNVLSPLKQPPRSNIGNYIVKEQQKPLLKSEKINQIKSLQKRLLLTYLKNQQSLQK